MTYFFFYLIITGAFSFILFGIDKYKATKEKWRISETHLLLSVAIGGWIGGVLGMNFFHHKTSKSSFLWKFWSIVAAWIVLTTAGLLVFK